LEISKELLEKLESVRPDNIENVPVKKIAKKYDLYSGGKYEGEVNKKGQFHGYGIYTDKVILGRRWEGYWINGTRQGYGIEVNHQGDRYEGEFKNGLQNGQGTFIFKDGSKYVGEFKEGVKHGQGTETWSDGDKYVGEFKNGKRNGQGTYTRPNGTKYVGEFKDGKELLP